MIPRTTCVFATKSRKISFNQKKNHELPEKQTNIALLFKVLQQNVIII